MDCCFQDYSTKRSSRGVQKKAAIFLHGNGSSSIFYYSERKIALAKNLCRKGIALLLFNNRGAHIIKKLTINREKKNETKKLFGTAFEKIKECIFDIDGAIKKLRKMKYQDIYLIGESTGANKICVYNYYRPQNQIRKYVLLSGGDDTGSYYTLLRKKRFYHLLRQARKMIETKKGENLMTELLPKIFYSYQGFYDIAHPDGDYNIFPYYEMINQLKISKKKTFRHFRSIKKPCLVIYGEDDEYCYGRTRQCIQILKKQNTKPQYFVIHGADHAFTGKEHELANTVLDWLS